MVVGDKIDYVKVKTFNTYTGEPITVILAKERLDAYFNPKYADLSFEDYKPGDKKIPYHVVNECKGFEMTGVSYEQLFPWIKPMGNAFEVIPGDFVTTEDGTVDMSCVSRTRDISCVPRTRR